jgi:hypothetical protein
MFAAKNWMNRRRVRSLPAPMVAGKVSIPSRASAGGAGISFFDLFGEAPSLGSLIDPRAGEAPLAEASFAELEPLLTPMLAKQDTDLIELAVTASGHGESG